MKDLTFGYMEVFIPITKGNWTEDIIEFTFKEPEKWDRDGITKFNYSNQKITYK